jgi:hypothetical protein
MQWGADGWKMTQFKDELAIQRIVDSVITELPAIGKIDPNNSWLQKLQPKKTGRGR